MRASRASAAPGARSTFDWYPQAAEILRHTDLPTLPGVLVGSIRSVVGFEHSAVFGYPEGRRPVFLYDGFGNARKRSAVAPYLNGTYRDDPFYEACVNGIEPGLHRMQDVAASFARAVVSPCISDEPGYLSEEIGFFARNDHGAYVVLSLMRPQHAPPFSAAEFAWLSRIAPVVVAAMELHWRDLGAAHGDKASPGHLSDHVDHVLETFGAPVLSGREQEIARHVLRGLSSEAIAHLLGITVATVKIHRRNIYAKLEISSQSQLFAHFLDLLCQQSPTAQAPVQAVR